MIKHFAKKSGNFLNQAISGTGDLLSKGIEKTGYDKPAEWVRETSEKTGQATEASFSLTGQVAEGTFKATKGQIQKDHTTRGEGIDDLKDAGKSLLKGVGHFVKSGASSTYETTAGLATKDYDRAKSGAWKLSQIVVVSACAISVVDFLGGQDAVQAESIQATNADYEGDVHPITGVPFERTEVAYENQIISDVFPVFSSEFTAQLNEEQYMQTDTMHFKAANMQLYYAIEAEPSLVGDLGLTTSEVNLLQHNITPESYTWHHHEQPGQLQLVDRAEHDQTAHTGGRFIWGGGSAFR